MWFHEKEDHTIRAVPTKYDTVVLLYPWEPIKKRVPYKYYCTTSLESYPRETHRSNGMNK